MKKPPFALSSVTHLVQYGYTATSAPNVDGPKYLRITDIQNGRVDWLGVPHCKISTQDYERYRLTPSDIVFARSGATVGKSFLIGGAIPAAVFASYLIRVRFDDARVCPRYGYYFFQSPDYWQQITEGAAGTGQPNFNGTKLGALRMPVPSLAEQRRIVAKLDNLLTRSNGVRDELKHVPKLIERYKLAVLAEAYRGDLTSDWRKTRGLSEPSLVSLDRLCSSIMDGDHQAPPQAAEGIPFITISAINGGKIQLDKATRFVPVAYAESLKPTRRPKRGDVLYSVTGSFGIPALVETDDDFVFQRHIGILRPDTKKATGRFVATLLASPQIMEQAKAIATGTAQKTVSLSGLRTFVVPLPPLEEQAEIIRRIDERLEPVNVVLSEAERAAALLDRLDEAILAKAFRGELAPSDLTEQQALESVG